MYHLRVALFKNLSRALDIFRGLDINQDGNITRNEFYQVCHSRSLPSAVARLRDPLGSRHFAVIRVQVLPLLGPYSAPRPGVQNEATRRMDELFDEIDDNGNGLIEYRELASKLRTASMTLGDRPELVAMNKAQQAGMARLSGMGNSADFRGVRAGAGNTVPEKGPWWRTPDSFPPPLQLPARPGTVDVSRKGQARLAALGPPRPQSTQDGQRRLERPQTSLQRPTADERARSIVSPGRLRSPERSRSPVEGSRSVASWSRSRGRSGGKETVRYNRCNWRWNQR